jgi:hypothetical protein
MTVASTRKVRARLISVSPLAVKQSAAVRVFLAALGSALGSDAHRYRCSRIG